jgi:hypothetical protein
MEGLKGDKKKERLEVVKIFTVVIITLLPWVVSKEVRIPNGHRRCMT